uniref:Uncharacterized protein n=1 Tax=Cyprinus carpio TaxID=7962 RepID=A0A8C1T547_CYPCA
MTLGNTRCFSCFQASVLENLRLAVRSQLGFTSIRLPTTGRHGNIWRRLFNFTRSRRSGSLALVSADTEEGPDGSASAREPERLGSHRGLLPLDSDDTDTESEQHPRRDVPGAVGGLMAPLPQKTPPTTAVEAIVSVSASSAPLVSRESSISESISESSGVTGPSCAATTTTTTSARSTFGSALSRVTRSLRWIRFSLGRSSDGGSSGIGQNHSPLRQLEQGSAGCTGIGIRGEDEDDVELLIPISDASSLDSDESSRPLLEQGLEQAFGPPLTPAVVSLRGRLVGRDGPCEHCGIVHTARIPDACLEATAKTESSDDESLLLC